MSNTDVVGGDVAVGGGARLRALMDRGCVAAPGAFDGLCAKAVAAAGFEACYVSGAATSVVAGVPDVGLLTMEHFCRVVREVADSSGLPVLADADTGFGEAEMVRRTVIEYARAGAAGLHLEDQVFPKRCGHLDGKALVPVDHMVEKVRWAAKAARDVGGGFVVCARTDARGVEGFEAAVERGRAYVEAGAEMIFPEGLGSVDEFARFSEAMGRGAGSRVGGVQKTGSPHPASPTPPRGRGGGGEGEEGRRGGDTGRMPMPPRAPYLLANMTEFGKTPMIPLSKFEEMGYSIVIYPVSMLRVAMGAVVRALEVLKEEGSVESVLGEMQTRKELYELVGYTPGVAWEYPVQRG